MANGDTVTSGQIAAIYAHFATLLAAKECHFRDLIDNIKESMHVQHTATEQAVEIASDALTERLKAANEIMSALDDMSRLMARRSELETAVTTLRAEIKATLNGIESDVRTLREDKANYATRVEMRPLEDYRIVLETKASTQQVEQVARAANFGRTLAIVSTVIGVLSLVARFLGF